MRPPVEASTVNTLLPTVTLQLLPDCSQLTSPGSTAGPDEVSTSVVTGSVGTVSVAGAVELVGIAVVGSTGSGAVLPVGPMGAVVDGPGETVGPTGGFVGVTVGLTGVTVDGPVVVVSTGGEGLSSPQLMSTQVAPKRSQEDSRGVYERKRMSGA